jgi:hypothetical protein
MTDPIVEHAKATLEIVDLLQMMVAECKCEAEHVTTNYCSDRAVQHCRGGPYPALR